MMKSTHTCTLFEKDNWRLSSDYLLAWYAKFLKLESASDKQLLKVTNLSFKLSNMGFNTFPYPIQKFRYANLLCNKNRASNSIAISNLLKTLNILLDCKKK